MKNKKNIFLLLFCMAFMCSCGNGSTVTNPVFKVKIFKVSESSIQTGLDYSGTIEAGQDISLSFLAMGTVEQINVREGDKVSKGQLLAKLNGVSSLNALQIAKEKAAQAEDAFRRFQPMYEHGNLPEIKMVEIKTAKTQAELAVKIAQKNLEDCSLYAPETGFISEKNLEIGDNVIPGKTVMKMVNVDKVYAVISVPEKEIQKIKQGMIAYVEFSENNGIKLKGTVADVGVSANPLSRTYTVRISIMNNKTEALPGMLCNVYIENNKKVYGIVIPAAAVKIDESGSECVYIVDSVSKKVHKQNVKTEGFRKGGIIISSGLKINDLVVSEGVQKLDDNTLIEYRD
ncbi:MAG: efflux RND transporter periplasmic adaptor subunit [Endomicrobiaceae bacterium]